MPIKIAGLLSIRTLWLVVLLIASSCALMLVGWVFAEWRVQHAEEEMRGALLHQAGELSGIIAPTNAVSLTFTSDDKNLPAFERIVEQFKAYAQDMAVSGIYCLGRHNEKLVYGPSLFISPGVSIAPGDPYKSAYAGLSDKLVLGERILVEEPERGVLTAIAPVFDPRSNEVLLSVVVEVSLEQWRQRLAEIRSLPFAIILLLLILQYLGVCATYLHTSLMPKRFRHLETVFVAVFCLLLTGVVIYFVFEAENRNRRMQFMQIADYETEIVESGLRNIQKEMAEVSVFIEKSKLITADTFSAFAGSLTANPAVESFCMLVSLQKNEQQALERKAQEEGLEGYAIYALDEFGVRIAVENDDNILYPIYYTAAPMSGEIGPGFDVGSIPASREALENAARTGFATAAIPVWDEIKDTVDKRISIYYPLYDRNESGERLLRGFVATTVRIDLLLQRALATVAENTGYVSLEMYQLVANEPPVPIASAAPKEGIRQIPSGWLESFGVKELSLNRSMSLFSHTYVLMVYPANEYFVENPIRNTYAFGLLAIVLAVVITVFVGILRNQQGALEARVWESTVELRESGETFRRLFSESTDPILLLKQGRIADCNNATLRLLKLGSKQQIVKRRPEDFSPSKQPDGKNSDYLFKEMVSLCVRNGHHGFEWTYLKSDGTLVPVETMFTLITIKGANHIHAVLRDITSRKIAEEALRSSEEKYRGLVDSLPIGLYRFTPSPEERFVMVNRAMVKIHGSSSAEELMQVPAGDLYANLEDRQALWHQLEEKGFVEGYEVQLKRKDGKLIWGSISGSIVRNKQGEIEYFDGSVMDITERKLAAEERMEMERRLLYSQKLESLGALAGGIAHDFNNLLTVVLGNLEFAAGEMQGQTAAYDCISKAVMAARRAAALTDQMLAYSGKGHFVIRAMDLSFEIEENIQIFRSSISKDINLELNLQEPLPPIYADAGQMQQAVMNLIVNASEAIGDNQGTISIMTATIQCTKEDLERSILEEKPEPGEFIVLEITDTGCGMDAETKARAFDPFFTTKFTGRGLGMSAVLGIVQGHKGALELNSEVGEGTTIRLLFPVAEPPEDLPVAEIVEEETNKPVERPKLDAWSGTFMVVDDEAPLRELGEKVLSRFGFDTITAVDGQEAVEIFREKSDEIVAVLLDLTMPRMDGVAAFEAMRRIKPDVKVILCSGFSEHEAMQRFSGQGLAGYVHKPYRITALRDEIEKVMKGEGNLA